jgi:hypothetical protein
MKANGLTKGGLIQSYGKIGRERYNQQWLGKPSTEVVREVS